MRHKWGSAGTDRHVVNAAAWLVNLERFSEKVAKVKARAESKGKGDESTREVET